MHAHTHPDSGRQAVTRPGRFVPVCVAGMHRSGTSMVTRLLNRCGMFIGNPDDLWPTGPDNPEGFFENRHLTSLNEALLQHHGGAWDIVPGFHPGWENDPTLDRFRSEARAIFAQLASRPAWGWKDPRNSVTLPFWKTVLPEFKVVLCLRNPLAVASSLRKRNGIELHTGLRLWYDHNLRLLQALGPIPCLVCSYERFFPHPVEELQRLLNFTRLPPDEAAVADAVRTISANLRHHRPGEGTDEVVVPQYLREFYDALHHCSLHETAGGLTAGDVSPAMEFDIPRRAGSSARTLLFVSHDASPTGPPLFLLNLLRWIRDHVDWDVRIALRAGGALENDFRALGATRILDGNPPGPALLDRIALVYSNTCLNGEFLNSLPRGNVPVITHAHEPDHVLDVVGAKNWEAVRDQTDLFIVGSQDLAAGLRRKGIPADQIRVHPYTEASSAIAPLWRDIETLAGRISNSAAARRRQTAVPRVMRAEPTESAPARDLFNSSAASAAATPPPAFPAPHPAIDKPPPTAPGSELPPEAAQALALAEQEFNRGHLDAARDGLRRALTSAPKSVPMLMALGNLEFQSGNLNEAVAAFHRVAALEKDNVPALLQLAIVALRLERTADFDAALANALRVAPKNPEALRLASEQRYEKGKFLEAARLSARLVEADSQSRTPGLLLLGNCFFQLGELETARDAFDTLLRVEPGNEVARANLELVDRKLGRSSSNRRPESPAAPPVVASGRDHGNLPPRHSALNRALNTVKLAMDPALQTMPSWANFQTSYACNLRCPHCQTHGTEEAHRHFQRLEMPPSLLLSAAEQTLPWAHSYSFTLNGEPLLTRNWPQLLERFGAFGARLDLTTNGTLLNEKTLPLLIPHLERLCVSLDGATQGTCELLRRGSQYARLLHNIKLTARVLQAAPVERPIPVELALTVMGSNVHELPAFVELAHWLGIRHVSFFAVIPFSRQVEEAEDLRHHQARYNYFVQRAGQRARDLSIQLSAPPPFAGQPALADPAPDRNGLFRGKPGTAVDPGALNFAQYIDSQRLEQSVQSTLQRLGPRRARNGNQRTATRPPDPAQLEATVNRLQTLLSDPQWSREEVWTCDFLTHRFYVAYNGDVAPCCVPGRPVLGNVAREPVAAIWNGSRYDAFRQNLASDSPEPPCRDCVWRRKTTRAALLGPALGDLLRARAEAQPAQPQLNEHESGNSRSCDTVPATCAADH